MGEELQCGSTGQSEAPWHNRENCFSKSTDLLLIARSIRHIKDNHGALTLVADHGDVCQQSLLVNFNEKSLQLDRPLEWNDKLDYFRVFFRDRYHNWNFFSVSEFSSSPFAISAAMPEELYFLQRRACQRVKVPVGTRALVKNGNQVMTTVFVKDLSAGGMLMSNDPADGEYVKDSVINDILVSIPPSGAGGENGSIRTVLPLIGQGRIVRSYVDRQTNRPCYGVSFQYDSNYVKDTINQIVSEVNRGVEQSDFI